ncbi:hypothetical protein [Methylobacterium oryzisoli]|uniref:hypothetical protein n=1 Tax=Methylobacterium oryzisoli TaxID=3385502 RepID=UPI00389193FC
MTDDIDLLATAKQDPVTAALFCQNQMMGLERGYHERLHYLITVGYAAGHALARDHVAWREFKNLAFWQHRKKRLKTTDQQQAHLHAMVFIYEAKTKQRYDRAWKAAVALEPFTEQWAKPEEVLAALQEHGIEELLRRSLAVRAQRKREKEAINDKHFQEYISDLFDEPAKTPEEAETADGDQPSEETGDTTADEQRPLTRPQQKAKAIKEAIVATKTDFEWDIPNSYVQVICAFRGVRKGRVCLQPLRMKLKKAPLPQKRRRPNGSLRCVLQ